MYNYALTLFFGGGGGGGGHHTFSEYSGVEGQKCKHNRSVDEMGVAQQAISLSDN